MAISPAHPVAIVFMMQIALTAGSSTIAYTVLGPVYAFSVVVGEVLRSCHKSLFGFGYFGNAVPAMREQ